MKNITELFKCAKCNIGTVKRTLKETKKHVEIKVNKCDNCKYYCGVKEVNDWEMISEVGTE
jgi:transcription elongation factor Elf1